MPTIRDQAVCIRHWDFSETSQTVSFFSRQHGVFRGLAKGSKREKGSFSGGIDLLTVGEVVAIVKRDRDLATLTQWHLERAFPALRQDLQANRTAWYLADLVHAMLRDHDPEPVIFDALVEALDALGASPATPTAAAAKPGSTDDAGMTLLRFQWTLLRETGYLPQLETDAETGTPLPRSPTLAFSARHGGVVADTGAADRWRVRGDTVGLLREIASNADAVRSDPATIERANRLLAAYLREILGTELPTVRLRFPEL